MEFMLLEDLAEPFESSAELTAYKLRVSPFDDEYTSAISSRLPSSLTVSFAEMKSFYTHVCNFVDTHEFSEYRSWTKYYPIPILYGIAHSGTRILRAHLNMDYNVRDKSIGCTMEYTDKTKRNVYALYNPQSADSSATMLGVGK